MTKDTPFVLDKLPRYPQISLFTGGSGQAFKFVSLLGKLLAELVLDQTSSFDLSSLSASRDCVRQLSNVSGSRNIIDRGMRSAQAPSFYGGVSLTLLLTNCDS